MKATELRIGNLVRWNYEESSEGNFYPIEYGYELDDIENNPNTVKPIPLTEEWLERFGFLLSFGGWGINPKVDTFENFNIKKVNDSWGVSVLGYDSDQDRLMFFGCGNINYVHQLQNRYFALTGEELQWNQD